MATQAPEHVEQHHTNVTVKRLAIILFGAYSLLVALAISQYEPGIRYKEVFLHITTSIAIMWALGACLWAARNSQHHRIFWASISFGIMFWAIGQAIYTIDVVKHGQYFADRFSIADYFGLGFIPVIIGCVYSVGRVKRPYDSEKRQFLANVAMTAIALFMGIYQFVIIPLWRVSPSAASIVYPVSDWLLIVSIIFIARRTFSGRFEGWVIILIAGFLSNILCDVFYWINDSQNVPVSVAFLNMMGIAFAASAYDEVTGKLFGTLTLKHVSSISISSRRSLLYNPAYNILIPLLTALTIPVVWFFFAASKNPVVALVLFVLSVSVIMISVYRSRILIMDNVELFATSMYDSLTGLHNHRYYQEALSKAIATSDDTGKPVSLIVFDIDNFSKLNAEFGHMTGDNLLTLIGESVQRAVETEQVACRVGGDDFLIIMPDTNNAEAYTYAKRLRSAIALDSQKLLNGVKATVSIGISTYPTLAGSKDELTATADGALYWSKFNGKNEIYVYDPEIVEAVSAEQRARKLEERSFLDTIRSLAEAVDARDPYTQRHSQGVSDIAVSIARKLGLDERTISRIQAAGMLHDVGKIGIPDSILNKPGKLTEQEMEIIRNHPVLSAQIIRSSSLKDIVPTVRAHHERWDGKGFPDGLKGEEIPLEARILAIADTFDAMTTDRPYRAGLAVIEALAEIRKCAGTQFDPELARVFLSLFDTESLDDSVAKRKVSGL